MHKEKLNVFWFRRDLRLNDNRGLFEALSAGLPVLPIFIFDTTILQHLPKKDARVEFIHRSLQEIQIELNKVGSSLRIFKGIPHEIIESLTAEYDIDTVYANRDYEPNARNRDKQIFEMLQNKQIKFIGKKDHVIFEPKDVLKDDGLPYTVYTPYSRKWKLRLNDHPIETFPTENLLGNFLQNLSYEFPSLSEMGFEKSGLEFPEKAIDSNAVNNYHLNRDFPAIKGTSRLSLHLRFGTVSTRTLVLHALSTNEKWLNELIWREFYQMIIYHFPDSANHAFKPVYDFVKWNNNEEEFKLWCEGKTGYPLVDAGMRELNATGFMHNRVRMVVASFLTKHLLIDWRWGERYFAEKLLDFELASNVGGWQWAAGSGCDAAPYFRVFNPTSQMEKFDKQNEYIKKWIPEFGTSQYVKPIVEHTFARNRCLETYKEALSKK